MPAYRDEILKKTGRQQSGKVNKSNDAFAVFTNDFYLTFTFRAGSVHFSFTIFFFLGNLFFLLDYLQKFVQ